MVLPLDATISDIDKVTLFYNTFRDIGRISYTMSIQVTTGLKI